MATYYFKSDGFGCKFKKDSGPYHATVNSEIIIDWNQATQVVFKNGSTMYPINYGVDTVNIDGVNYSGSAEGLQDALRELFPKPNSGTGGSGEATTDASLLTSGTLPDARLSSNIYPERSLLTGKKAVVVADSFGDNSFNLFKPALTALGMLLSDITIDSVGGSCITAGTTTAEGDGTNRVPIVDRIDAALALNPDVLIIEGGANDWYYNINIGDYYLSLVDIAKKVVAYNNPLQVLFINLTQRNTGKPNGAAAGRVNYAEQRLYAEAAKEVFYQYAIPVLDMFSLFGVFENSDVLTTDGVHPNAAGIAKYRKLFKSALINPIVSATYTKRDDYVLWGHLVNFGLVGHTLTHTSNGTWDASARGEKDIVVNPLTTGVQASLEVLANDLIDASFIGLSDVEPKVAFPSSGFSNMKYSLYWSDAFVRVFEGGNLEFQQAITGTTGSFRIDIEDVDVKYYYNNNLIYTSAVAASGTLFPVSTVGSTISTVKNATLKGLSVW